MNQCYPNRILSLLLFLLCSLPWLAANAEQQATPDFPYAEAYFETVGDVDSIPDGSATVLAQDQKGFLWIGTQNGLLRFDGYRFRKFLHDASDPASLPGDSISALWVDKDDRLWVGTGSEGLAMYDPASGRFQNFSHDPANPESLVSNIITALSGDAKGGIWVGTERGLDYLAMGSKTFTHYRHHGPDERSLQDDRIRSLLTDRQGHLWVGTEAGLQRFEAGKRQFSDFASLISARSMTATSPAASVSGGAGSSSEATTSGSGLQAAASKLALLEGQPILALFEAQDGKLWFGTRNRGAGWLQPASGQWQLLNAETGSAPVTLICQPAPGQIWLAVNGDGLHVRSPLDGHPLQHLRHDASIGSSLAHDDVRALLLDRAGLLWIGAVGGGLQRFNTHNLSFRILRHSPNRPQSLSHPDVRSVLELADGRLLVGLSGKRIDILDRKLGRIGSYQPQTTNTERENRVSVMLETADGTLWVGTRLGGVFRLAKGSSKWQNFALAEGLPDVLVHTMLLDRHGELWVGTKRGLALYLPQLQRFKSVTDAGGKAMLESVHALVEDAGGRIWAASHGGLWVRENNLGLRLIQHEASREDSLIANRVNGLLVDHSNRLWLDTAQGLERLKSWNGQRAGFEHISILIGRGQRSVGENLLEDGQGRIWTETMVIDPQQMRFHELSKADGIDLGVNWFGAKGKTRDGLLLFGGSLGLAIVDPARFQPWNYQPPVRPTELKLGGIAQALGALYPVLNLSPEQRDFSIEFSALDFSMPQSLRYSYRLQGYDRDWISTDASHRSASYGNLWPGLYTLQVRATNRSGRWSEQELLIPVRVLPAFWQTGWFLALALLLASSALYVAYRWRLTRLRSKARMLQKMVDAQTKDLQVAHARLSESEKMAAIGSLVAGLAHEINTPLGTALVAMSGAQQSWERLSEAIASGRLSKSALTANSNEGMELTRLAVQTAARAASLIRTLQSIAIKVDTDQCITLDLAEYLQDVASQLHERLVRQGCNLSLDVTSGLQLTVVTEALTEALTRIMGNCLDHAFAQPVNAGSPTLCLRARQHADVVQIDIIDNGKGIAADELGRVFEPFFSTRSGDGQHVGLGLHIAWNQVTQRLQGEISIASVPGNGCTVSIRLKASPPVKVDK